MKYDFIEIGTSDFDTLSEFTDSQLGISVEPLKIYLDNLPEKKNYIKVNCAISDKDDIVDIFWIHPDDIKKYNLPNWLRGCNSIIEPHPSAVKELEDRNLLNLYNVSECKCLSWNTFVNTYNIEQVEYLKIDTEGHDCIIINNILDANLVFPKKITFENNILSDKNLVEKTLERLKKNGYNIIDDKDENITVQLSVKIDKIIFSVDDNPLYDGFWELNSEICHKKLGITPVLFHITNEESDFYEDNFGLVKKIKSLPNFDTGFQAQAYRMFGTKYFINEYCLISDIDMFMINKEYFLNPLNNINQDDLVIYSSDAYSDRPECTGINSKGRYPICYNWAKGETFDKILNTNISFENYMKKIREIQNHLIDSTNIIYTDNMMDEMYFGYCVDKINHGVKVHKLSRGYMSWFKLNDRVDRNDDDKFNYFDKEKLIRNEYIDFHLARPYSRFKKEIDEVKDLIMNN